MISLFNADTAVRLHALILGAIQGLCEFLPVSSSGHLALFNQWAGDDAALLYDSGGGFLFYSLLLHCATMLAALIFFRRDIFDTAAGWLRGWFSAEARHRHDGWLIGWAILLADAITAAIGLPLKSAAELAMGSPMAVGCGLLVTSALLAVAPLVGSRLKSVSFSAAAVIGIAQGLAVLPGVSRSGATIFAALLMGLTASDAFRFSFLISIPAVFGASLLEARELASASGVLVLSADQMLGAAAAFILGMISLSAMRRLVISGKWAYFSLYCLLLGCGAIVMSLDIL